MDWMSLFRRKTEGDLLRTIQEKPVPNHIAIIMDGNGRWATARQLPRAAGHRQGVEALRGIIRTCSQLSISHLTLYAFSTENWKRPKSEVHTLMSLMVEFLQKEIDELHENGVKIQMLGDIRELPQETALEIEKAMKFTRHNNGLQVNIAINYGSRTEILKAVRSIVRDYDRGRLSIDEINEECFSQYLSTRGIPDPDLLIRTGGEYRLSNFLLYQSAYTELYFTDKKMLWPDFNRRKLLEVIQEYQNRLRKFGGISDEKGV